MPGEFPGSLLASRPNFHVLIVPNHPFRPLQCLAAAAYLPEPVIEHHRSRAEQEERWNPVPEGRSQDDPTLPAPQVPEDEDHGSQLEEEEDQQERPDRGCALLLLVIVIAVGGK